MGKLSGFLVNHLVNDGWVGRDKQDELSEYLKMTIMLYRALNMSKEDQKKLIQRMKEKLSLIKEGI